jgi:hypothetical protein
VVNINIYIYYTKIYVTLYNLKCIANFEFQKLSQNSMVWRSTCFYIVTFVHWNIMFIKSCMYKSVLGKINKLQKNFLPFLETINFTRSMCPCVLRSYCTHIKYLNEKYEIKVLYIVILRAFIVRYLSKCSQSVGFMYSVSFELLQLT